MRTPPVLARGARIIATAVGIGIGASMVWANAISWGLEDWRTYLAAAERVAAGGPIYEWTSGAEHVYRYAPWFAYALVPFLALPRSAADVIWSGLVLAGTAAAVIPLVRQRTWAALALAMLGAGLLMRVASTGNVNPILIGALVAGLQTRAGPLVVALAASLKAAPLLFAAVYLAERRWMAAGLAVGLTLVLVVPMAWLGYEITPGPSESLFGVSPIAWFVAALAALAALAILAASRSRHAALAAGAAAYLALPRSFVYDIALVLPGAAARSPDRDR